MTRDRLLHKRLLYIITPPIGKSLKANEIPQLIEGAIKGGAQIIQWRQKRSKNSTFSIHEDNIDLLPIAHKVRELTQINNIPFIVNDSLDLALQLNADGIHIGQTDASISSIQNKLLALNKELIIGVTVRNKQQAQVACEGGASYLGVGPVFQSTTKPDANNGNLIGIEGLRECVKKAKEYNVPVYAIGGVSLQDNRIEKCMKEGGATGIVVIAAIGDAEDKEQAARALREELEQHL